MSNLEQNKRNARTFLELAFNKDKPREAVEKFIGPYYINHDPRTKDGAEGIIELAEAGLAANGTLTDHHFKRTIGEGDIVATTAWLDLGDGGLGMTAVDIFRFEDGKIVEHWDVTQMMPEASANDNGLIDGPDVSYEGITPEDVEYHRAAAVDFIELGFNQQKPREAAEKYLGPVFIQHPPLTADGKEAFVEFAESIFASGGYAHHDIRRVLADGDMVLTHSFDTTAPDEPGMVSVNVFRFENRKIVEHWGIVLPVPEEKQHDNPIV